MTSIKEKFIATLKSEYPDLNADFDQLIFDNLISPYSLEISAEVFKKAERIVKSYFELRQNKKFLDFLNPKISALGIQDPGNYSILMSYDFHLTPANELKLIEINTNASFLAMGDILYKAQGIPQPQKDFSMNEIIENIQTELNLQNKKISHPRIAILDENPETQKLYIEFLIYQKLFQKRNLPTSIEDTLKVSEEILNYDFIYNRYTDFTFSNPSSVLLKKPFNEKSLCFSPHPYEYVALADKDLMKYWSDENFLNQFDISAENKNLILNSCLKTFDLTSSNKDEIWASRKKLFFKAKNSYGSKQTYRGDGISRSLFDRIVDQNIIAQEFIAPPLVQFGEEEFKYDLRFYAYQGRVQSCIGRLYKGQVTNSQTKNGGFASIRFV